MDETLTHNPSLSEGNHIVTTAGVHPPGQLCQRLRAAVTAESKARVLAANEHVAAAVYRTAKRPVQQLTTRGAMPYRIPRPIKTPDGRYLLRKATAPPVAIEFIADTGVELTATETTLELPFSDVPADAFTDLPDGFFLAEQSEAAEEWTITAGDGTVVTSGDSQREWQASYSIVRDWFQPDRLTYLPDITIHYPDPADEETLKTYGESTQQTSVTVRASLSTFLEEYSVSCTDSRLAPNDVYNRYIAWLNASETATPELSESSYHLERLDEFNVVSNLTSSGQQGIKNRAWCFPPTITR